MKYSPVIVIGMHRSGTTPLVRILEHMGLFMGHDQDPNAEARFFLRLNEQMLAFAGARWDQPTAMRRLLGENAVCERLSTWLEERMAGPETRWFMRKTGWLRHGDVRNYPHPWGWKDPRNTLTLPLWLHLFPEAKVIHMVRHGIAVAASLRERERRLREETLQQFPRNGAWRITSPLCLDLFYGLRLWAQYLDAAEATLSLVSPLQQHVIHYEQLLEQPDEILGGLGGFLGMSAPAVDSLNLRAERARAWRRNQELTAFAEACDSPWLQRLYPDV